MAAEPTGAVLDFDRHFRRAVWITTLCAIIGAGIVYAGKAADDRSAFIRWRHQVLQFWSGENIYDAMMFPNPPIMPLTLLPFMLLQPVPGALCWFALKSVLTAVSVWLCFRMVRPPGTRPLPSYVQAAVLLLSFRPILSDLHHGNNNLVIMFLIVASLYAWRKGYDVLAGLVLALAIHRIEHGGERGGFHGILTQQQPQAEIGFRDPPRRVDARAERIAAGACGRPVAGLRHIEQRGNAWTRAARHHLQSLTDQRAIDSGERHHVAHGRQRDEIEQTDQVRLLARVEKALAAKRARRRHRRQERNSGGT